MIISNPIRLPFWQIKTLQSLLHLTAVAWVGYVFYLALSGQILGDPVQYLIDFTGLGAINLLFMSLAISPSARIFKFSQIMILRRPLGVYAAVYGLLHFAVFVAFELQFEMALVFSEVIDRPYITVGFSALVILSVLLISSLNRVKRALGRRWQQIHNWVYVAAPLVLLHFIWSLKTLDLASWLYIMSFVVLIIFRIKNIQKIIKK